MLLNIDLKYLKKVQLTVIMSLLIFFLGLQFYFWYKTENIKPYLAIVPNLPSEHMVKAFSFGDEELYFRTQAFKLQNAGDTYGRVTPLKDYDYEKLYKWFKILDNLDPKSNYVPSLAAYYYSQVQDTEQTIYIIDYLEEHADKNPEKNWWWYYQAMYIASYVYKDKDRALELADKLSKTSGENAPFWTKHMKAVILKDIGNDCESLRIVNEIAREYEKRKNENKEEGLQEELNFMRYFIEQRIQEIKRKNIDPASCGL